MVAEAVERFGLVQPGDRVLCALSGGADSVCLTHAMAALAKSRGFTLAAAHFSHGLRPESAADERDLCQRLCDSLNIPLFCGKGDTPAFAEARGLGLEEAARLLRRDFLTRTAREWQADAIATGHHLEDSAETLLLNLIRGSGSQGLQGIPPKGDVYIRPLILAEKQEILRYIRENRLEYADDPTNFTGENARARLRREVFPALAQLNTAAVRHLARTALDNWERDERLRWLADAFVSVCRQEEGEVLLDIEGLLALPEEAAVRALQTLQRRCGGKMLERPHLEAIFGLCRGSDPSAQTHLPGSRALRRYGTLVLTAKAAQPAPAPVELWPDKPVTFGPWEVILRQGGREGLPVPAADFPLLVRSRQAGDVISLACGSKSLKKLLIERKIPKDLRDSVPILCDNRKILAVGSICAAHDPGEKKFRIICRRKEI